MIDLEKVEVSKLGHDLFAKKTDRTQDVPSGRSEKLNSPTKQLKTRSLVARISFSVTVLAEPMNTRSFAMALVVPPRSKTLVVGLIWATGATGSEVP